MIGAKVFFFFWGGAIFVMELKWQSSVRWFSQIWLYTRNEYYIYFILFYFFKKNQNPSKFLGYLLELYHKNLVI
jgi:hypothetical protein